MRIRRWIWAIGGGFVGYSVDAKSADPQFLSQILGAVVGALIGFAVGYAMDEYFSRNSRRL